MSRDFFGALYGPGSEGSEGSACLRQAGSKGGGIALSGDEFICCGGPA